MRFRLTGKQAVRMAGCAAFCLIVCVLAFWNRTLVLEPAAEYLQGNTSFAGMTDTVRQNYLSDLLRGKNELISLNGGLARLESRIRYNEINRTTNGMLTGTAEPARDPVAFAKNLSRLNLGLKEKGIPFLFVLTPNKMPLEDDILFPGVTDHTNEFADQVVAQLQEREVPVLDLRQEMSRTREQVEKYFYRTDHHWNVEGSFYAFQRIMEAIREVFPDTKLSYTDSDLWEKTVRPNWWLGSQGRRVGPLFVGTDDLDYYLPAFETEMSRYSIGAYANKGDFRKACMHEWLLEVSDYFRMDTYSRYLGGGYPLTLHRNQHAENQKKLFMIRDSFMLPVECFLSTELTSIDVIDPRGYGKMNEMDYITLNPPDMVIMMLYSGVLEGDFYDSYSNFSAGTDLKMLRETRWEEITASGTSGGLDYEVLPMELESGKSYVLTLDHIRVENGAPEGASVVLMDGEEIVDQTIFDIEYGNQFEFRWGFQIPESEGTDHNYQLRFYAGIIDATEDVELVYRGVCLQECYLVSR